MMSDFIFIQANYRYTRRLIAASCARFDIAERKTESGIIIINLLLLLFW